MRKENSCWLRRGMMLTVLSVMLCTSSGCALYDWLVSMVQKSFAGDHDYDVSVVDCKHIQNPDDMFVVTSSLTQKINDGVRQAVRDVGLNQRNRNIALTDSIPQTEYAAFQEAFFEEDGSYDTRMAMLRKYCEDYGTNIIMWGATMGDDYELAFVGYMYRRDLDVISTTDPLTLEKNTSERLQEKKVQDAMHTLLAESLETTPLGGVAGTVANELYENKGTIIITLTPILLRTLSGN